MKSKRFKSHHHHHRQSSDFGTRLKVQTTELGRLNLLNPNDFVFDLINASSASRGPGGIISFANVANFPALVGRGVAITIEIADPCSINLPHSHPRATEINFVVSGKVKLGFFEENGARFIENTLTTGMVSIFPQAAIHFVANFECKPAIVLSAFNNEDPGVLTIANAFFGGLPAEVVGLALGNLGIQTVQELISRLPLNPAIIDECRTRCGYDNNNASYNPPSY
eukprot:TRINITY_DN9007_c0_g1_i2.p1 TRINITY_DN9007_c0_g1~~TRINITY_DN9007_c0_g1_i2.p1  ORF type:complete len:225 (+),score=37.27 TRINITY_DN9007_c0_g1_i2:220-894(+)